MSEVMELRLEVESIMPDTPSTVSTLIKEAVDESIYSSGIDQIPSHKPSIVFEQHLPSTEEMGLIVSVVRLVIDVDPLFFSRIKSFFEYLFSNIKLKKVAPTKINAKLAIGDKTIEIKNLSIEDTLKIITKDYEILFMPNKKG